MKTQIAHLGNQYEIDLAQPLDISIALKEGEDTVNAFFAPRFKREPVKTDTFIGSVEEGGPCDFYNLFLNPHGTTTHTECLGHIAKSVQFIEDVLTQFVFLAEVISIDPHVTEDGDRKVMRKHLETQVLNDNNEALIVRTLPNTDEKLTKMHSGSNPAYLDSEVMEWIKEKNIRHLLLDLPSVDKETDGGVMKSHHVFWNYTDGEVIDSSKHRVDATITELIYVPDSVPDGQYILNLMIGSIYSDASPSKPVLYKIFKKVDLITDRKVY
ncbi:MAG: cyclase family protein [Bacteroidetes bacterium]|nr:cyclase family protein [Bacteroidota bacterium]